MIDLMATSSHLTRRGRPPGSTPAELLATARELFVRDGFRGTTMESVASRARVSKQSLYATYPSKAALFAAVVHDWVDRGRDAMRPAMIALEESNDVCRGLTDLALTLQQAILSPPVLQMRLLVAGEAEGQPEVAADYLNRSWEHNIAQLGRTLRNLSDRGDLEVDDDLIAAEQFVWLVIGPPLNQASLRGPDAALRARRLRRLADEGVETFLRRYGPSFAT